MKERFSKNKNITAFTLIELLVVIFVIALIFSLATISFFQIRKNNRDAKRIADITQIQIALEGYKFFEGVYPDNLTSGQALIGTTTGQIFLDIVPINQYYYNYSCSHSGYDYTGDDNFYTISFCLEGKIENYNSGSKCATPEGIFDGDCSSFRSVVSCLVNPTGCYWQPVGQEGFSGQTADFVSLSVYEGAPYVVFSDYQNESRTTVMKYTGVGATGWESVGDSGFSDGYSYYHKIFIDNGSIYVAYIDQGNNNEVNVLKYNGSNWSSVVEAGYGDYNVHNYLDLFVNNNNVYISYSATYKSGSGSSILQLDLSNWAYLSSVAQFKSSQETSLYVKDGSLYFAYSNSESGGKIEVAIFSELSWSTLGLSSFSDGEIWGPSLYVSDEVYVAYTDYYNNYKATVMKYTGGGVTGWESVGEKGFSDGEAWDVSLFIYNNEIYVAYSDKNQNYQVTVMKYTGGGVTGWESVGEKGFSSSGVIGASYISLFIENNIPYVSYSDYNNENKATVMKFAPGL